MLEKNFKIDEFTLDINKRELFYKNAPVRLSSRAFDILHYLLQKKGTVVTKDELLDEVWADSFVEEANLAVHISAIRRVLKESKGETKYIKTISGRGYSFVSDVVETSSELNDRQVVSKSISEVIFEEDIKTSLAILPLVFEEKGNKNEYLANGITQSLINDLSQISNLRVLSYSAVKTYKNSEMELQEIGFLLDADKLFTGHIYEYDDKYAIVVELINAGDKSCVWGKEYLFEKDDIFEVKKQISNVIAKKLKLKLNPLETKKEIDAEAQKLYYRGKFILESRTTKKEPLEYLNSALDFFRKAVEIEPKYALAHIGIGAASVSLHNLNLKGKETYKEAKNALRTALEIDSESSEIHVLKGSIEVMFDDDLIEAKKSFEKAIELNPNNPDAYHWKGLVCMFLGEYEDAFKFATIATELDPTSIRFNEGLMRIFFYSGDYERAITHTEELLEFDNKNSACHLFLALGYAHRKSFDLAMDHIDICIKLRDSSEHFLNKAFIYALFGKKDEANEIVNFVLENYTHPKVDYRDIAFVYAALNEKEKAIENMKKAQRVNRSLNMLKNDVRFKNLQDSSEFKELFDI